MSKSVNISQLIKLEMTITYSEKIIILLFSHFDVYK